MSSHVLRNESTKTGQEMWRAVDRAASKAPEWIRQRVENAPLKTSGRESNPGKERPLKG